MQSRKCLTGFESVLEGEDQVVFATGQKSQNTASRNMWGCSDLSSYSTSVAMSQSGHLYKFKEKPSKGSYNTALARMATWRTYTGLKTWFLWLLLLLARRHKNSGTSFGGVCCVNSKRDGLFSNPFSSLVITCALYHLPLASYSDTEGTVCCQSSFYCLILTHKVYITLVRFMLALTTWLGLGKVQWCLFNFGQKTYLVRV